MGLFGPKLQWSEPWSWASAKETAQAIRKALPPFWRMFLYAFVVPFVGLLSIRYFFPDAPSVQSWWQICGVPVGLLVGLTGLPFLEALCPLFITIYKERIGFSRGSSALWIDVARIRSLHFRSDGDQRFFVVCATTKRGKPLERIIKLPVKKMTEQDVIRFLYDMELAHLLKADESDGYSVP